MWFEPGSYCRFIIVLEIKTLFSSPEIFYWKIMKQECERTPLWKPSYPTTNTSGSQMMLAAALPVEGPRHMKESISKKICWLRVALTWSMTMVNLKQRNLVTYGTLPWWYICCVSMDWLFMVISEITNVDVHWNLVVTLMCGQYQLVWTCVE